MYRWRWWKSLPKLGGKNDCCFQRPGDENSRVGNFLALLRGWLTFGHISGESHVQTFDEILG